VALSPSVGPFMHRRVSRRALYWRRVIHLGTLKALGHKVFMPNRSTPDYLFEEAERCFRRSRTDSNVRVELEALGNMFMVKAVELDIKLQKIANGNYTASSPTRV
jgi:hypothetical protein